MRKLQVFAAFILTAALASSVIGQEAAPTPPPAPPAAPPAPNFAPPSGARMPRPGRSFAITSREDQPKRIVSGKCMAMVIVPNDVKEASVTISFAGKTFNSTSRPHRVEIDTAGIQDGEYEATAVARDTSGAELWKGKALVAVDNAGKLAPQTPQRPGAPEPAPAGMAPAPPMPADQPAGDSPKPKKDGKNRKNKPADGSQLAPLQPAAPNGPETEPPVPPMPDPGMPAVEPTPTVSVTEVFQNKKLGIKMAYPAGWKVEDHTSQIKPKEPGACWLAFTSPEAAPKLTVNFRHRLLKQATTPDSYSRYNPYLQQWSRVTVNGKPAFETTQGQEGSGRIVHRKLIVDGKDIWQFNCIDQTGKPSVESKSILDQIAISLVKG